MRTTGGSPQAGAQRLASGTALHATQLHSSVVQAAEGRYQAQSCCDAGGCVASEAASNDLVHKRGASTHQQVTTASNAQGPRRRTVLITARFWSANNSSPRPGARCIVGTAPTLAHHAVCTGTADWRQQHGFQQSSGQLHRLFPCPQMPLSPVSVPVSLLEFAQI